MPKCQHCGGDTHEPAIDRALVPLHLVRKAVDEPLSGLGLRRCNQDANTRLRVLVDDMNELLREVRLWSNAPDYIRARHERAIKNAKEELRR